MSPAGLFILIVLAVGAVLDVALGVRRGGDATISWTLYGWARRWPSVAFLAGYLCGHIFGTMQ